MFAILTLYNPGAGITHYTYLTFTMKSLQRPASASPQEVLASHRAVQSTKEASSMAVCNSSPKVGREGIHIASGTEYHSACVPRLQATTVAFPERVHRT
jgi:hypothetical protein